MHVIKLETLSALNRPGFKNRFSRANFVNLGRTHPKFPFENLNIGRQQISNFCIKHNHLLLHKMSELMHTLAKEAITKLNLRIVLFSLIALNGTVVRWYFSPCCGSDVSARTIERYLARYTLKASISAKKEWIECFSATISKLVRPCSLCSSCVLHN